MSFGAIGSTVAGGVIAHNSGGGGGSSGKARSFVGNNNLFNVGLNANSRTRHGTFQATGDLGDIQQTSLDQAGLFSGMAQNNQTADLASQLGLDFLNQVRSTSPFDVAQNQFDLMSPLLNNQFNQDNLDLESRLFAQGRLGGTGGSNQQNALFDSQNDSRRQLLFDSLSQGLATQQQNANLGIAFGQLDPQLRGLFQGLGTNSLNNALNINQAGLNQFSTLATAAGGGSTGGGGINAGQAIGAGLLNSGVNGLTGLFNGTNQTPSS